ncbi:hypothetical protein CC80DRAFT_497771 [Byssothecium circinans]|uniref:Lysozyme-like protein n=1 Tax=Byssothecium circinans TaxID=147558 RepID=A0A6A5TBI6_9PLEO|nr:hypothetical protein CC80DRAFT_497771 [Byssothecium circinans]
MVNTKSLALGFALVLSAAAAAVPVGQMQIANCKGNMHGNVHAGNGTVGPQNGTSPSHQGSIVLVTKASTVTVYPSTMTNVSSAATTTLSASTPVAVSSVGSTVAPSAAPSATPSAAASAAPSPASSPSTASSDQGITAEQLIAITPGTASCSGGEFPSECADASKAAPAISKSLTKYGFTTAGEKAALVALMLFESGNFKYSKNHFPAPGRPGQGTRNMQSEDFNKKYLADIKGGYADVSGDALVAALSDDEASFGSAAWFLKTQCSADVAKGLQDGSQKGWEAYLTKCVGTTHTAERDVAWKKAKEVLGVKA